MRQEQEIKKELEQQRKYRDLLKASIKDIVGPNVEAQINHPAYEAVGACNMNITLLRWVLEEDEDE